MARRGIPPGRLRRRLTIVFLLVAGISAGSLALGSYLLVREARLRDSLDRAEEQTRFNLVLAQGASFGESELDPREFVSAYERRDVHAVLHVGNERFPSDPSVDPQTPSGVRDLVRAGEIGYQRVVASDERYLMIGGRPARSDAELYFLFSEERIHSDLVQLRNVLIAGWLAVLVVAGLVGRRLARGTLEPVARASDAARSIAEGLLATRLPVEKEDEFGVWAASFNEMAEALEAKITELSEAQARERRFTSDVAHELRTPLAALVGEASMLKEHIDAMPLEARRPAELLVQDVGRLRRLVDELMEISRFDAGRERLRVEPLDLLSLTRAAVRARGWEARVAVDGEEVRLSSDRRRLERVIANLVGNALEHGGRDPRVRVGPEGAMAYVEVLDRGPGIPPEHLPHLFERFYKADPARSGTGSGLGLAIAMENAKLLGGDIEVWSEVGVGSRFTFRISVAEPLQEGEGAVSFLDDDGVHSPSKGGTP
ncbi:MAG: ATP-binding protein [Actinomycetota bacterium]